MGLPKTSKSTLGKQLAKDIASFMKSNAKYLNKEGTTEEEGNQAIAEAIAYGISRALSDSKIKSNIKSMKSADTPLSVSTTLTGTAGPYPIVGTGAGTATTTHGTEVTAAFDSIISLFEE